MAERLQTLTVDYFPPRLLHLARNEQTKKHVQLIDSGTRKQIVLRDLQDGDEDEVQYIISRVVGAYENKGWAPHSVRKFYDLEGDISQVINQAAKDAANEAEQRPVNQMERFKAGVWFGTLMNRVHQLPSTETAEKLNGTNAYHLWFDTEIEGPEQVQFLIDLFPKGTVKRKEVVRRIIHVTDLHHPSLRTYKVTSKEDGTWAVKHQKGKFFCADILPSTGPNIRLAITVEQKLGHDYETESEIIEVAKRAFEQKRECNGRFHLWRKPYVRSKREYVHEELGLEYTMLEDSMDGRTFRDMWIRLLEQCPGTGATSGARRFSEMLAEGVRLSSLAKGYVWNRDSLP